MAVRPESESESDDDKREMEMMGVVGEKIKAEKEVEGVKEILDPRRPTAKEVGLHNRTHLPYRNWCPHCVRAKGKDLDHRRAVEGERGLPEFSFDFPRKRVGLQVNGVGW